MVSRASIIRRVADATAKVAAVGADAAPEHQTEKGKPSASWGRKARGLAQGEIARLPVHTTEGAYTMKQYLFSRRGLGWATLLAGLALVPAQAASASTALTCPTPVLSQPFSALGDTNQYTMAPGQAVDNFAGTGWTLSGGASITTTKLADGSTGSVLNLPAGSKAVSPQMCVSGGYPSARMDIRSLGTALSAGTMFYVSPAGSTTLSGGLPVVATPAWAVSAPVSVAPGSTAAEMVQYTLVGGAKAPAVQVYNLYVDPRMH
jgi:hypothetical protein